MLCRPAPRSPRRRAAAPGMALGGQWALFVAMGTEPFLDTRTAAALACTTAGTWAALADTFVPRHFLYWWHTQGERLIHDLSADEIVQRHGEAWASRAFPRPPAPPREGVGSEPADGGPGAAP